MIAFGIVPAASRKPQLSVLAFRFGPFLQPRCFPCTVSFLGYCVLSVQELCSWKEIDALGDQAMNLMTRVLLALYANSVHPCTADIKCRSCRDYLFVFGWQMGSKFRCGMMEVPVTQHGSRPLASIHFACSRYEHTFLRKAMIASNIILHFFSVIQGQPVLGRDGNQSACSHLCHLHFQPREIAANLTEGHMNLPEL